MKPVVAQIALNQGERGKGESVCAFKHTVYKYTEKTCKLEYSRDPTRKQALR